MMITIDGTLVHPEKGRGTGGRGSMIMEGIVIDHLHHLEEGQGQGRGGTERRVKGEGEVGVKGEGRGGSEERREREKWE